jgi:hypothetical protein
MRAESDWVTAVEVGRIQDKTRWTKALGEAVTFVYGDCTGRSAKADVTARLVVRRPRSPRSL